MQSFKTIAAVNQVLGRGFSETPRTSGPLLPHHNLCYFKYPNHIVGHAQRYVRRKISIVCTSFNEVLITGTSVIALIWLNFTTTSLREVLCIKAEICYVSLVCGT